MAGVDNKFCSWNVRGVNHPIKRKKILTFLEREQVKIALLQETHLRDKEHIKLELCEELGYLDAWRITHPGENLFFFFQMHTGAVQG